jgi:hypothetical protein
MFLEEVRKVLRSTKIFSPSEVGHLIPLRVGHRDQPTSDEVEHINTILAQSSFLPLQAVLQQPDADDEDNEALQRELE